MDKRHKSILSLMFFLSGFCGLAYQIIWLRKAFAVFGVITPMISVVVSVFMLGLFMGSWAGGRWIKRITEKLSVSAIYIYAATEILIGLGGVLVPYLFLFGDRFLLPVGNTGSFAYLLFSGLAVALAMFPWCVFMGTTYPFMMTFLEEHYSKENGFSFLYLANVAGAMIGTLLTAFVMIELFGFRETLLITACMNFAVALLAVILGAGLSHGRSPENHVAPVATGKEQRNAASLEKAPAPYLARTILFITGFSSMGMEVVWTRAFTPASGTYIYSFAGILVTYLAATAIGSGSYRRQLDNRRPTWGNPLVVALIAVSSLLPVVLADFRVPFVSIFPVLSIIPICLLLGYLTPKLIDEYSGGDPEKVGRIYAVNIAGCVLGPLFASYVLLPFFGSRISTVLLALPLMGLFMKHLHALRSSPVWRTALLSVLAALVFCSLFISISFEEGFKKINGVIRHDYAATVLSYGKGLDKHLLVNGVGMTRLTSITKDMAHLPLVSLDHKPQTALAICLGMGTSFRSLASWGIDVTAVELVPGVREAFGYYHPDADRVLSRPNARIIIDDGRRFLRRTEKKFDVIIIDPPPPVEAAGSSLLYSEEFYSLIRARLKPGGILQQWFPETEKSPELASVTMSLMNSFPYVQMYLSVDDWGYHYLASMSPIRVPAAQEAIMKMPEAARKDRLEWDVNSEARLAEIWNKLIRGKTEPASFTLGPDIRITDDRPFSEYFLLRRMASGPGLGIQSIKNYFLLRSLGFINEMPPE